MSWFDFCELNQIGSRFYHVKCDKQNAAIIASGMGWIAKPHSLVLHGNPGTGKTHFSLCLAKEALKAYGLSEILWKKSKKIDTEILDEFNTYGTSKSAIKKYCDIMCLFIDDFGIERATERSERDFYEIIDTRWENDLITVITTNLSQPQIQKSYGDRILSRLKDSEWVKFNGPDLRGLKYA